MWRDQDISPAQGDMSDPVTLARFNYFHTEVWLWHPGPALTSSANHRPAFELWTNENEACGQLCDTVTKCGELRSSHSQHPLSLVILSLVMNYAAKMCRVSFMREAPAQLRVSAPLSPGYYLPSIWHLTGSLWFLLILTDVNRGEQSNKSPAVGCGKLKESRRNSLERRGCCDVQSRHPWSCKAGYFSLFPFPFYVGPAMKINMSRIAGEWRIGLRHLAPLKARVPLDLSHAALRFTFRGTNSSDLYKM